jgi:hypothetical protein
MRNPHGVRAGYSTAETYRVTMRTNEIPAAPACSGHALTGCTRQRATWFTGSST